MTGAERDISGARHRTDILADLLAPHQALMRDLDRAYAERQIALACFDQSEERIRILFHALYDALTTDLIRLTAGESE